ncbi:hypothetical protein [Rickettsia canadensis]|uniref:Uncharacterized protein n=1 Tax=Rickettsia canadensis str. CA410 TaxID=1105107 RepID=A0ABM5MSE6_RICCA|nr:hypothetical protein [Rickettsia canadensis]AFB20984.1 hypothetical protein RCA_02055 [Rickettsia canadensis str. CA410]
MGDKLDLYEQDIENNFKKQQKFNNQSEITLFQKSAKIYVSKMSILNVTNRKTKKEFLKG